MVKRLKKVHAFDLGKRITYCDRDASSRKLNVTNDKREVTCRRCARNILGIRKIDKPGRALDILLPRIGR